MKESSFDGSLGGGSSAVVKEDGWTTTIAQSLTGLYHNRWLEAGFGLTLQGAIFNFSVFRPALLAGVKTDPVQWLRLELLAEGGADVVSGVGRGLFSTVVSSHATVFGRKSEPFLPSRGRAPISARLVAERGGYDRRNDHRLGGPELPFRMLCESANLHNRWTELDHGAAHWWRSSPVVTFCLRDIPRPRQGRGRGSGRGRGRSHLARVRAHADRMQAHLVGVLAHPDWMGAHLAGVRAHPDWVAPHLAGVRAHPDWMAPHLGEVRAHPDWMRVHLARVRAHPRSTPLGDA
jgi:hypothetical protein